MLHQLEPDPETASIVARIFREYIAGAGIFAIAEGLTRDGVLSPSAQDRARNQHRTGEGWAKSAVRAILADPRYTGRQVWAKQRKDELLIDVEDVGLGHQTRMRWNDAAAWVWSNDEVHAALVTREDFEAARDIAAGAGRTRSSRARQRVRRPYVLRGLVRCGVCERKMQGQWTKDRASTPAMWAAQPDPSASPASASHAAISEECDAKLATCRSALEAGADPALVSSWIAEIQARRAAAARAVERTVEKPKLTKNDVRELVSAASDIHTTLARAQPAARAEVYL